MPPGNVNAVDPNYVFHGLQPKLGMTASQFIGSSMGTVAGVPNFGFLGGTAFGFAANNPFLVNGQWTFRGSQWNLGNRAGAIGLGAWALGSSPLEATGLGIGVSAGYASAKGLFSAGRALSRGLGPVGRKVLFGASVSALAYPTAKLAQIAWQESAGARNNALITATGATALGAVGLAAMPGAGALWRGTGAGGKFGIIGAAFGFGLLGTQTDFGQAIALPAIAGAATLKGALWRGGAATSAAGSIAKIGGKVINYPNTVGIAVGAAMGLSSVGASLLSSGSQEVLADEYGSFSRGMGDNYLNTRDLGLANHYAAQSYSRR